ncbi:zinc finger protein [Elysia marginata]|uniref:Zinc finger protein n=1 Tax=Elysia marginata TaxID=1093978 RepID=A0AAV4GKU0_9GAST|nr:zinc finger protein [Elysia marginata]
MDKAILLFGGVSQKILYPQREVSFKTRCSNLIKSTDVDQLLAAGFESFPCLSKLVITNSFIKVIPQGAFPRTVNASLFRCSKSNSNTPKSKLQELDLKINRIHTIEDNSLMAPHLQWLDLSNKSIKCIDGKFLNADRISRRGRKVVSFEKAGGIVYRRYEDPGYSVSIKQVVLPKSLREYVMSVAHDSQTQAHLGIRRTKDKALSNFY